VDIVVGVVLRVLGHVVVDTILCSQVVIDSLVDVASLSIIFMVVVVVSLDLVVRVILIVLGIMVFLMINVIW
jgi:hypothetical protein